MAGNLGNGRKRPLASSSSSRRNNSGSQRRRRTLADWFGRPGRAPPDEDERNQNERSALVRPAILTGAMDSSYTTGSSSSSNGESGGAAAAAPVASVNAFLKWSNRAAQEAAKAKAVQSTAAAAAASMWGSDGRGLSASSSYSSSSFVSPYAGALAAAGLAPHARVPDWALATSRGDPFLERHWPPWVAARVCLAANPLPPPRLAQLLRHKPEPRSLTGDLAPWSEAAERGGRKSEVGCGEGTLDMRPAASSNSSSSSSSSMGGLPEGLRSEVEHVPAIVWWVGGCRRVGDNPPLALARWLAWRLGLPLVAVACVHPWTMDDACANAATITGVPPGTNTAPAAPAPEPAVSSSGHSNGAAGASGVNDEDPDVADDSASAAAAVHSRTQLHKGPETAPSLYEGRGAALYASALVNIGRMHRMIPFTSSLYPLLVLSLFVLLPSLSLDTCATLHLRTTCTFFWFGLLICVSYYSTGVPAPGARNPWRTSGGPHRSSRPRWSWLGYCSRLLLCALKPTSSSSPVQSLVNLFLRSQSVLSAWRALCDCGRPPNNTPRQRLCCLCKFAAAEEGTAAKSCTETSFADSS